MGDGLRDVFTLFLIPTFHEMVGWLRQLTEIFRFCLRTFDFVFTLFLVLTYPKWLVGTIDAAEGFPALSPPSDSRGFSNLPI